MHHIIKVVGNIHVIEKKNINKETIGTETEIKRETSDAETGERRNNGKRINNNRARV